MLMTDFVKNQVHKTNLDQTSAVPSVTKKYKTVFQTSFEGYYVPDMSHITDSDKIDDNLNSISIGV